MIRKVELGFSQILFDIDGGTITILRPSQQKIVMDYTEIDHFDFQPGMSIDDLCYYKIAKTNGEVIKIPDRGINHCLVNTNLKKLDKCLSKMYDLVY